MKLLYALLAVAALFVLNVSFSSTYSEEPLSISRSVSERVILPEIPAIVVNSADSLDQMLEQAIWDNDKERVDLVLKQGADVNRIDPVDGYAPLHWAVERGLNEIIETLLRHGADVDLMTKNAIGKDRTALHMAAEIGKPAIVRQLLANNADVNATTAYNETPLHGVRLFVKNIEVVELLIEAGADVNAKTTFGSTPLHSAAILGASDIVNLLIDEGAGVNTLNKRGLSPLHHAAQHGHEDVIMVLLSAPVSLDIQTRNGDTALHLAAKEGHAEVVDLLLRAGANPLTLNKFSKSPLAEAKDRSYANVVELLSSFLPDEKQGS